MSFSTEAASVFCFSEETLWMFFLGAVQGETKILGTEQTCLSPGMAWFFNLIMSTQDNAGGFVQLDLVHVDKSRELGNQNKGAGMNRIIRIRIVLKLY